MKPYDFVTSDHHFGHANVLKYQPDRALVFDDDIAAHDEGLIARWNAVVPPEATVYHLGDFAFAGHGRIEEIVSQLNGRIVLVRGNHDRRKILLHEPHNGEQRHGFHSVHEYLETQTPDGIKVCLMHFPIEVWNRRHHEAIHLHGHTHAGRSKYSEHFPNRMDVGVDGRPDMAPWRFDEVRRALGR